MYTLTIWNKNSTNFGANEFVQKNGTERIETESKGQTLHLMMELMRNKIIHKVMIETATGSLTWERSSIDDQEIGQNYGSACNCSECDDNEDDYDEEDDDSINFPESF
jgi:hypothetical protein